MSDPAVNNEEIARVIGMLTSAQNSCPVHEQCDSSCQSRIGVKRYFQTTTGERLYETDLREQLAATSISDAPTATAPKTIPDGAPKFYYTHLPRPGSMIRLLKLSKGVFRTDPVECEMVTFDIANVPPYGALSYCWGGMTQDCKMLCNGQVASIGLNLESALKRLRAGFPAGKIEEYIWADAICINQQDVEEKTAQILMMQQIYSRANMVYVDLGSLQDQPISIGNGLQLTFKGGGGMGAQDIFTDLSAANLPFNFHAAIQALKQPWFRRTWIIQEVALAQRVTYMFNGNVFNQQQLDTLLDRRALTSNPDNMRAVMVDPAINTGYLNYVKLQQIRNTHGKMDSLELMQLTRDYVATEPADKIFGVFALISPADRKAVGAYSQPVGSVYRRFAAFHVNNGRTMKLLDCAGLQKRKLGDARLASWVPDWTAQGVGPRMVSNIRYMPYAASGQTQIQARLVGDSAGCAGLSIRGVIVDTIEVVSQDPTSAPPANPAERDLMWYSTLRAVFDQQLKTRGTIYIDNEDAFARTLLMDDTYTGGNAMPTSSPITNPAATCRAVVSEWQKGQASRPTGKMDTNGTFRMQYGTVTSGRRFAGTKGGLIGLVPHMAKSGDHVVVFYGGTVPYVLREVPGGYLLVGDSYVHGIMHGFGVERPGARPVDITLV